MYHNITFRVIFYAGDREEWRVYTDSGMYHTVKSIEEIGPAIKELLQSSARSTLARLEAPK